MPILITIAALAFAALAFAYLVIKFDTRTVGAK